MLIWEEYKKRDDDKNRVNIVVASRNMRRPYI